MDPWVVWLLLQLQWSSSKPLQPRRLSFQHSTQQMTWESQPAIPNKVLWNDLASSRHAQKAGRRFHVWQVRCTKHIFNLQNTNFIRFSIVAQVQNSLTTHRSQYFRANERKAFSGLRWKKKCLQVYWKMFHNKLQSIYLLNIIFQPSLGPRNHHHSAFYEFGLSNISHKWDQTWCLLRWLVRFIKHNVFKVRPSWSIGDLVNFTHSKVEPAKIIVSMLSPKEHECLHEPAAVMKPTALNPIHSLTST